MHLHLDAVMNKSRSTFLLEAVLAKLNVQVLVQMIDGTEGDVWET